MESITFHSYEEWEAATHKVAAELVTTAKKSLRLMQQVEAAPPGSTKARALLARFRASQAHFEDRTAYLKALCDAGKRTAQRIREGVSRD